MERQAPQLALSLDVLHRLALTREAIGFSMKSALQAFDQPSGPHSRKIHSARAIILHRLRTIQPQPQFDPLRGDPPMPQPANAFPTAIIPPKPMPEGAQLFSDRVHTLLDGKAKDEASVAQALSGMEATLDAIAAGLYNLASMLVGQGEDSIALVETAVTNADVSACKNAEESRKSSRRALVSAALQLIDKRQPGSLRAPEGIEVAGSCIDDDDLDAAGVSSQELERMFAGPDRQRIRTWLESLPADLRTVFVLRAVAGFCGFETAELLVAHAGPSAAGWTADSVRSIFRQGLCSLASQLLVASTRK
jgi:DNA-directed RNA polymerase specialized sigma24 family protein